jgi:hypothetical protein
MSGSPKAFDKVDRWSAHHVFARRISTCHVVFVRQLASSQRADAPLRAKKLGDREARRAYRTRVRMGWPGGILEGGYWDKPKGVH